MINLYEKDTLVIPKKIKRMSILELKKAKIDKLKVLRNKKSYKKINKIDIPKEIIAF